MIRGYRKTGLLLSLVVVGLAAVSLFSMRVLASSPSHGEATSNNSMAGMQMAQASAQSSRPVVLKHRSTVHVNIRNLAFGPASIVVSPGTKIIWTNKDDVEHTTTSDHGLWDSPSLNQGAQFVRAFKKTGVFTYHCTIHPFMHGTIAVAK